MLSSEVPFGILESCWITQLGDLREETFVWLVERDMVCVGRQFFTELSYFSTSSKQRHQRFWSRLSFPHVCISDLEGWDCVSHWSRRHTLFTIQYDNFSFCSEGWMGLPVQFNHSVMPDSFDPMDCSTPGFPVHHQLPELVQIHVHRVSDASSHLILCRPLRLLPPIPPSIRIFSNESTLRMRRPKYWSFSFSISPSNEHPGLISFRMDWLDLLALQWTLKSLLQYHSSKASILQCSAFFIVQLSHPYMTTGKNIDLTRWTFVGKVMSLFLICYLGWS